MDKHLYSAAGPMQTKVDEGEINKMIFKHLELDACVRTHIHTLHVFRLREETYTCSEVEIISYFVLFINTVSQIIL